MAVYARSYAYLSANFNCKIFPKSLIKNSLQICIELYIIIERESSAFRLKMSCDFHCIRNRIFAIIHKRSNKYDRHGLLYIRSMWVFFFVIVRCLLTLSLSHIHVCGANVSTVVTCKRIAWIVATLTLTLPLCLGSRSHCVTADDLISSWRRPIYVQVT